MPPEHGCAEWVWRASGSASLPGSVGPARLQLWPQRAAFDPDRRLLMVADVHLGKGSAFRRLGVPVPEGGTADDLNRLDGLLDATAAQELIVLGDLLHAPGALRGQVLRSVLQWRAVRPLLRITLVRGNHDQRSGDPPAELEIRCEDAPVLRGPWALLHEPQAVPGAYALAGHVHPCVRLDGGPGGGLRFPCFHFGASSGILPAYGSFTGMHPIRRAPGDSVYALVEEAGGSKVVDVSVIKRAAA